MRRVLLLLAGLLLALAIVLPFQRADRFKEQVRAGLEAELGRKVEVLGPARFTVWTGLGITLDDVIIHELPEFGREPIAYVTTLEAHVSPWSLWRRIEFTKLRWIEPSVNLTRREDGAWNLEPLFVRTRGAAASVELQVRAGRINFKTGSLKSSLYLLNADLDLKPGDGGRINVRFSAEPARTDRAAQGFGRFEVDGRVRLDEAAQPEFDLSYRLERTPLSELALLVESYGLRLDGRLSAEGQLKGGARSLTVDGRLLVEGFQRREITALRGGWTIRYRGELDLEGQRLSLDAAPADNRALPVALRLRASEVFRNPRWALLIPFDKVGAASLADGARQLGISLPAGFRAAGTVAGALGLSRGQWQGCARWTEAEMAWEGSAELKTAQALIVIAGDEWRLEPAQITLPDMAPVGVEGTWKLVGAFAGVDSADVRLNFGFLPVAKAQRTLQPFLGSGLPDVLAHGREGELRGQLRYQSRGGDFTWSGSAELRNASWKLEPLAAPLTFSSLRVTLDGARQQVEFRAAAGGISGEGQFRQDTAGTGHLNLTVAEASTEELEDLLRPALDRQGFLARTLRFRSAPVPEWLAALRVDGSVRIQKLDLDGLELKPVRLGFRWRGAHIALTAIEAHHEEATLAGSGTIALDGAQPRYEIAGRVARFAARGGEWDLEGRVETDGLGGTLLDRLHWRGVFLAREVELGPGGDFTTLSGECEWMGARANSRVQCTGMRALRGGEALTGEGGSQPDGRLQFEWSGPQRLVLAGTPWPLQLAAQP